MIIDTRFNGPAGSGNGGYAAGTIASAYPGPGPVEVTLRRPPPLGVPLTVRSGEGGAGPIDVCDPAGELVAQARGVEPFDAVVPGVPWQEAVRVAESYPGFTEHPFPTCYVCGPSHPDGLRIFPGRLPDGRTAAPFVVPDDVTPATVWAALDCPGGWAIIAPGRPYVLGRIAAVVAALPAAGDGCVVVGTTVDTEGRKARVRSTLYGPTGDLLAHARAVWIAV